MDGSTADRLSVKSAELTLTYRDYNISIRYRDREPFLYVILRDGKTVKIDTHPAVQSLVEAIGVVAEVLAHS